MHLGKSPECGHYICYTLKNGEWIYFNDDKVAKTSQPQLDKGYIYFYK